MLIFSRKMVQRLAERVVAVSTDRLQFFSREVLMERVGVGRALLSGRCGFSGSMMMLPMAIWEPGWQVQFGARK